MGECERLALVVERATTEASGDGGWSYMVVSQKSMAGRGREKRARRDGGVLWV